jgi:hypothetical protein
VSHVLVVSGAVRPRGSALGRVVLRAWVAVVRQLWPRHRPRRRDGDRLLRRGRRRGRRILNRVGAVRPDARPFRGPARAASARLVRTVACGRPAGARRRLCVVGHLVGAHRQRGGRGSVHAAAHRDRARRLATGGRSRSRAHGPRAQRSARRCSSGHRSGVHRCGGGDHIAGRRPRCAGAGGNRRRVGARGVGTSRRDRRPSTSLAPRVRGAARQRRTAHDRHL